MKPDPEAVYHAEQRLLAINFEEDRAELRAAMHARSEQPGSGHAEFHMRTGYYHREAFALMRYQCEVCGVVEVLWNSRDGVTPFSIGCRRDDCNRKGGLGCPMSHIEFNRDRCDPNHVPRRGDRIFASMTMERARLFAKMRIRTMLEQGARLHMPRETLYEALVEDFYRDGFAPDVVLL